MSSSIGQRNPGMADWPLALVATTPVRVDGANVERMERVAKWFGCKTISRRKDSLASIFRKSCADAVIVADEPIRIFFREDLDHPLFFHPGMAHQRISQLRKGGADRLVTVANVQAGDVVLDATMGLGSDSLVLAEAVGPNGRVIAVESSLLLARLFQYAQVYERHLHPFVVEALERVEVHVGNHLELLRAMDEGAVDIVYFDPMFRSPLHNASSNLESARSITNPSPLSHEAWEAAKRVARRAVVLKERPGFGEFERFGVVPDKPRAKFAFGVWRKENRHGCQ
ncbi:class I SAM-dependent methyltransferase [Alicyclobacillus pomorum]|uniref:class I SAM-dependent methyltransferase n=1 Tax=Alicyclobacillus pomorum TaxID=204470 RepID=UPI00146FC464|nr:class I SAM-dependent methyltransferase [Alicyclobacillus pomorum]